MQVPLELAFHGLDHSDWAEAEIRRRVDKLERLHDRLTAVRVRVELEGRQHRTGNVFTVHVEMSLPGKELVVSQEPHRAKQRYREPSLRTAIRDAFEAAERQLLECKRQISNVPSKPHEAEMKGQVSQIIADEDRGFLLTNTGSQLYFTRNAVMNGDFDALRPGDPVYYIEMVGDIGPIAKKVRRAEQTG